MLTVYGFSRVNSFARGRTRDLRVLWRWRKWGFAALSTVELPILYLIILGFTGKDDPRQAPSRVYDPVGAPAPA